VVELLPGGHEPVVVGALDLDLTGQAEQEHLYEVVLAARGVDVSGVASQRRERSRNALARGLVTAHAVGVVHLRAQLTVPVSGGTVVGGLLARRLLGRGFVLRSSLGVIGGRLLGGLRAG